MARPYRKWIALLVALVLVAAAFSFLPLADWLRSMDAWVEDHGALGVALFALAYFVGVLVLLPELLFTVAAGAMFGMAWGFVLTLAAAVSGATVAFLIARYALRERIEKLFSRNPVLAGANQALRKEGWKIVGLMRLSPLVPFGVQNYFFGVTEVKLVHYVLATAAAITPGSVVALFLGATGREALTEGGGMWWGLLAGGLVVTVVFAWLITKLVRKRLGIGG